MNTTIFNKSNHNKLQRLLGDVASSEGVIMFEKILKCSKLEEVVLLWSKLPYGQDYWGSIPIAVCVSYNERDDLQMSGVAGRKHLHQSSSLLVKGNVSDVTSGILEDV